MSGPTFDSIWVAGERHRLADLGGLKVVTFRDPGGYSFIARRGESMLTTGSPGFGKRRKAGKVVRTLEDLRETVHQVVLHSDLTADSRICFETLVNRGLSTHFMIDWDGTIYQGLDVLDEAYHAGEANAGSVGIDLNNLMKNLVSDPGARPYPAKHSRLAEMNRKEHKRPMSPLRRVNGARVRSYGYTDAQYRSLLALMKVLIKILPRIQAHPPLDVRGEVVTNTLDSGLGFEGFLGHFHISPSRWDPGPGFDWQRVRHGLAREHNAFPVELEAGVNISSLLEPDKVQRYAQRYFANNEQSGEGGWYPLGRRQNWHGGVHLHAKRGATVRAMFDGRLVAGRFGRRTSDLGHSNFLVLRHDVEIPRGPEVDPETLTFFSLYMHLGPLDTARSTPESPEWLRALHRVHSGRTEEEEEALRGGRALAGEELEEATKRSREEEDPLTEARARADAHVVPAVGPHLAAFKRGEIALIPWKKSPIRISSGEPLGTVGEFGQPDVWSPMIHVEVFAEETWRKAVEMGVHGRYFSPLEGDFGDDLLCGDASVIGLFEAGRTRRGKRLTPTDIENLYTATDDYEEERKILRKVVSRHVSEWSDQVNWIRALTSAEDWDTRREDLEKLVTNSGIFREALEQVLPFVWLNQEVADHMGLDTGKWDGVLSHFHPIHFLLWLTYHSSQRIQVISQGLSLAQLKARIRKEERRERKEGSRESDSCVAALVEVDDVDARSSGEVLEEWFDGSDQGEWRVLDDD